MIQWPKVAHKMTQVSLYMVFRFQILLFLFYFHFWVMVTAKKKKNPKSVIRSGEGENYVTIKEIIIRNLPITFGQFLSLCFLFTVV